MFSARNGRNVTGEPLTDRVMPALDMSQLARFLVHGAVGRLGEDGSIGRPEVAVTPTTSIGFRDGLPKPPTGGFTSVSHDAGHDLSSAPTSRPSGPSAPRNCTTRPLPGRPLPRPGVRSRLPGGERRLQDRPDGDPIQPMQPPQADPLRIGSQNLLLLRLRIPHLGFQDPIGPTGLAVVLLVPISIPSVLDDVHTPASTAPVSPGLRNPGTPPREDSLYDASLTKRSLPKFTDLPFWKSSEILHEKGGCFAKGPSWSNTAVRQYGRGLLPVTLSPVTRHPPPFEAHQEVRTP